MLVAFDPDQAGRRAAVHAYHLLVPLTEKLAAVTLPAGQDPAQILPTPARPPSPRYSLTHTRPLPDLVINAEVARWSRWLRYAEGQIHALRAAAPLIAAMPPPTSPARSPASPAMLRLDHATVTEAVTDALAALAANPADSTCRDTEARKADPRGQLPPVIRAAGHESPHTAQQTVGHTARTTPPAHDKQTGVDQRRLPARHARG